MNQASSLRVVIAGLTLGTWACGAASSTPRPASGAAETGGSAGDLAGAGAGANGDAGAALARGTSGAGGGADARGTAGAGAGSGAGAGGEPTGAAGAPDAGRDASAGAYGGGGHDAAVDRPGPGADAPGASAGKQVLVWLWLDYANNLAAIAAHPKSFTHISPALYQINYAYQSGITQLVNGNDNFNGLTSKEVTQKIHDAGLKSVPLMYGGSGNSGTDQGIHNVLNDSPAGAQRSFITSMVAEAKAKGHDGYNLDWEVDNTGYAAYGTKLISFLTAFKSALNAEGLQLSFDLGGWYVRQCSTSGGDGLVDLAALGHAVDLAIIEDYAGSFGTATATCPAQNAEQVNCEGDFLTQLTVMCNLPRDVVSIGVISPGANSFAADALAAVTRRGWSSVAIWPSGNVPFLDSQNMPGGATWYSVFAGWLAQ